MILDLLLHYCVFTGVGEHTRLMTTQAEGDEGGEKKNEHRT